MTKGYQQVTTLQEHLWFKARIKRGTFITRDRFEFQQFNSVHKQKNYEWTSFRKHGLFNSELSQDNSM